MDAEKMIKAEPGTDDNSYVSDPLLQELSEKNFPQSTDVSDNKAKNNKCCATLRSFPLSVFLIIGNELCERFSFYGMRAILVIYFVVEHQFSEARAILVFHAFVSVAYAAPLVGSIAADNFFGKYLVIVVVSVIYVIGHVLLTLGAVPQMVTGLRMFFDFSGLLVIALATGGIKPCVSAFGADQLKENKRVQEQYFSLFYFSVNAGSLIAILLTPTLRGRVKCLGSEQCFPLAFGVPAVLMLIALLIFLAGSPLYKKLPAAGNIIWNVCKCFGCAFRERMKGKKPGKHHWLDYAHPKYEQSLVEGVKSMWDISVVFIPVPFFWALFDQQGSTWVLQARRMNAHVGPLNLLPDQINVLNPIFMLGLIPLTESVYPFLRKAGVPVTPLRRMVVGGLLAIGAFVLAAFVQLELNKTVVHPPQQGRVSVTIANTIPHCDYLLEKRLERLSIPNVYRESLFITAQLTTGEWQLKASPYNNTSPCPKPGQLALRLEEASFGYKSVGFFVGIFKNGNKIQLKTIKYELDKTENAETRIYLLAPNLSQGIDAYLFDQTGIIMSRKASFGKESPFLDTVTTIVGSNVYQIWIGPSNRGCTGKKGHHPKCFSVDEAFHSTSGSASVLLVWEGPTLNSSEPSDRLRHKLLQLIPPNSLSVFWQIPQFFLMTLAEVLFSIAGLEFSYSQAAPGMRSVCQAIWLLTVFFGNCLDMAISGSHVIKDAATEFFVYATLMTIVMAFFVFIAAKYQYVHPEKWKHLQSEEDICLEQGK